MFLFCNVKPGNKVLVAQYSRLFYLSMKVIFVGTYNRWNNLHGMQRIERIRKMTKANDTKECWNSCNVNKKNLFNYWESLHVASRGLDLVSVLCAGLQARPVVTGTKQLEDQRIWWHVDLLVCWKLLRHRVCTQLKHWSFNEHVGLACSATC